MKKMFAILLTLVLVFSVSATARVEATPAATTEPLAITATAVEGTTQATDTTGTAEHQETPDGTLTIENIKQSTWEELLKKIQNITSFEDKYVQCLVEALKEPQTIPIYHDTEYESYCMAGLRLDDIDTNRMIQKCQAVVDLYNASHSLQLEMTYKFYPTSMSFDIKSTNLKDIENPVMEIGQFAVVKEGTVYWETSQDFGSGKHNTVTPSNIYVPQDRIVTVNAVSYLSEDGNINSSFYRTFDQLQQQNPNVQIEIWQKRMVHICTDKTDLGWVYPENLTRYEVADEIEMTPEEFAEEIQAKEGTTIIYVDQSGSMSSFVEQATRAFDKLDKTDRTIIVFAEYNKVISKEQINDYHSEIGGSTNIYGALNTALQYAPKHIIIISDLCDTGGQKLLDVPTVETVEILCPDENYPRDELQYIKDTWKNATVTLSIIK